MLGALVLNLEKLRLQLISKFVFDAFLDSHSSLELLKSKNYQSLRIKFPKFDNTEKE